MFIFFICYCSDAQSCLTFCDPMDCSPPGSSVNEIFQTRILEWVAIFFSRGSSQPLPDVQAGFRKGRRTRDEVANICWIIKKAREFQKNIYFCFIDYAKAFDCVDHNKLWKILKDGNSRPPDLTPEKSVYRSRSNR